MSKRCSLNDDQCVTLVIRHVIRGNAMKHKSSLRARIAICLPQPLHDTLSEWAHTEDRPLTNLIRRLLTQATLERERELRTAQSHEEMNSRVSA